MRKITDEVVKKTAKRDKRKGAKETVERNKMEFAQKLDSSMKYVRR